MSDFWNNNKDTFKKAGIATLKGTAKGTVFVTKKGYKAVQDAREKEAQRHGKAKKNPKNSGEKEEEEEEEHKAHSYSHPMTLQDPRSFAPPPQRGASNQQYQQQYQQPQQQYQQPQQQYQQPQQQYQQPQQQYQQPQQQYQQPQQQYQQPQQQYSQQLYNASHPAAASVNPTNLLSQFKHGVVPEQQDQQPPQQYQQPPQQYQQPPQQYQQPPQQYQQPPQQYQQPPQQYQQPPQYQQPQQSQQSQQSQQDQQTYQPPMEQEKPAIEPTNLLAQFKRSSTPSITSNANSSATQQPQYQQSLDQYPEQSQLQPPVVQQQATQSMYQPQQPGQFASGPTDSLEQFRNQSSNSIQQISGTQSPVHHIPLQQNQPQFQPPPLNNSFSSSSVVTGISQLTSPLSKADISSLPPPPVHRDRGKEVSPEPKITPLLSSTSQPVALPKRTNSISTPPPPPGRSQNDSPVSANSKPREPSFENIVDLKSIAPPPRPYGSVIRKPVMSPSNGGSVLELAHEQQLSQEHEQEEETQRLKKFEEDIKKKLHSIKPHSENSSFVSIKENMNELKDESFDSEVPPSFPSRPSRTSSTIKYSSSTPPPPPPVRSPIDKSAKDIDASKLPFPDKEENGERLTAIQRVRLRKQKEQEELEENKRKLHEYGSNLRGKFSPGAADSRISKEATKLTESLQSVPSGNFPPPPSRTVMEPSSTARSTISQFEPPPKPSRISSSASGNRRDRSKFIKDSDDEDDFSPTKIEDDIPNNNAKDEFSLDDLDEQIIKFRNDHLYPGNEENADPVITTSSPPVVTYHRAPPAIPKPRSSHTPLKVNDYKESEKSVTEAALKITSKPTPTPKPKPKPKPKTLIPTPKPKPKVPVPAPKPKPKAPMPKPKVAAHLRESSPQSQPPALKPKPKSASHKKPGVPTPGPKPSSAAHVSPPKHTSAVVSPPLRPHATPKTVDQIESELGKNRASSISNQFSSSERIRPEPPAPRLKVQK